MFNGKVKSALYSLLLVAIGGGIGYYFKDKNIMNMTGESAEIRDFKKDHQFINPLLACEGLENVSNKELLDLKNNVASYINQKKKDKDLSYAAIYFRDLNNGPWFGIDEKNSFNPGSLLKVPLVMTVFNIADRDPSFLDKVIEYAGGDSQAEQFYLPDKSIEIGKKYTVMELIEYSLKYSDNNATLILSQIANNKDTRETYSELGVEYPETELYKVSVRTYASFFRILFNASYLDRDYSEKILEILSEAKFSLGLRAGVPAEVPVSHKFGEREIAEDLFQLHDCGIVYVPEKPYLLCIMTQGKQMDTLSSIIRDISKMTYESVTLNNE